MVEPGKECQVNLVSVTDGDTLDLSYEGVKFVARLQWISNLFYV